MNLKDIKDLIITIDKTTIDKVEIEKNDIKIVISKNSASKSDTLKTNINSTKNNSTYMETINNNIETIKNEISSEEYSKDLIDSNVFIVKSPIVGTFYKAASPDSLPFVNIGDIVKKGQTLCIIEAMKIMNEIECEVDGEVVEIFVENEDIVEFGQPLMVIRR